MSLNYGIIQIQRHSIFAYLCGSPRVSPGLFQEVAREFEAGACNLGQYAGHVSFYFDFFLAFRDLRCQGDEGKG